MRIYYEGGGRMNHVMRDIAEIALVGIAALVIVLSLEGGKPAKAEAASEPSIYITRTSQIRDIEGRLVWVLEYTVDGVVQSSLFKNQEAMTEYRAYLDTIGTVYQRETEEGEGL
jgi:hypothetical protein